MIEFMSEDKSIELELKNKKEIKKNKKEEKEINKIGLNINNKEYK